MADDDNPKRVYNRTPVFKDGNYTYWKENIYVHLLSLDKNLLVAVIEGYFIPKGDGSDLVWL